MENYIGVKIVKAEPQEKNGVPGYRVKYPDNYVSWSPKETFEKVQQCRMQYQSEIENLLSKITCLEEIQQYNSQKIEHILKLKEVFQSTQISEITKEFANKLIKRVEVSPTGAVDVIFYFDELLNEIEVHDIA